MQNRVLSQPRRSSILPAVVLLFVVGCTDVTTSGNVTTLTFKFSTVAGVGVTGLASIVFGILLLIKILPKRLVVHQTLHRKVRAVFRFSIPVIFGVGLLFCVVPFAWYKIEAGSDSLTVNEFPTSKTISKSELTSITIQTGKQAARIHVVAADGAEYFINESEVGSDGFKLIKIALERLIGQAIENDRD